MYIFVNLIIKIIIRGYNFEKNYPSQNISNSNIVLSSTAFAGSFTVTPSGMAVDFVAYSGCVMSLSNTTPINFGTCNRTNVAFDCVSRNWVF